MKFWELTAAFSEESEILDQVLAHPKWKNYQRLYQKLPEIVEKQQRQILDAQIPDELALEVCSRSNKIFWYYPTRHPQVLSGFKWDLSEPVETLNATAVFNRFGGKMLEEIHEKSYAEL